MQCVCDLQFLSLLVSLFFFFINVSGQLERTAQLTTGVAALAFSQGQLAGIVQVVIEWDPARKYEYSFVADENWEVSKALAHLCDRRTALCEDRRGLLMVCAASLYH